MLTEIAEAHHATPRQIALAFLTLRPSVFAIPKASSVDHVEENAGAYRLLLSSADRQLKMSDARGRMEEGGNTMITVALFVRVEAVLKGGCRSSKASQQQSPGSGCEAGAVDLRHLRCLPG